MEKEQHQFNLEFHLIEWKRGFAKTSLTKDDVDELAQHLRDHFDELVHEGKPKVQAWYMALQAIGSHRTIVKEFDKVWYIFLKNTFIYYVLAFAPFVLVMDLRASDTSTFFLACGIYFFIYRTFIDFWRLRSRNAIDKNGLWRLLLPGSRVRYFRELYFY